MNHGYLSHFSRQGQYYDSAMNTSSTAAAPAGNAISLKQDAGVIGLVGTAHLISHFSQLLLAPLFPWLKEEFTSATPNSAS
jgi:FSR family fosmidomycin resistance protein-like MFS transporter